MKSCTNKACIYCIDNICCTMSEGSLICKWRNKEKELREGGLNFRFE
jgi:hypothetical protein